jgi:hypothetical protein
MPTKKSSSTATKAAAKKAVPAAKKAAPVAAKKKAVAAKAAPAKKAVATKAPTKAPAKAASPAKKGASKAGTLDKFLEAQLKALQDERENYTRQATALRAEADQLAQDRDPGDVQFDEESGQGDSMNV